MHNIGYWYKPKVLIKIYCENNIVKFIDPATDAEPVCCDKPPERRHPGCWPIEIPPEDPFYSAFRRRCMEFVRSATGLKEDCKLGLHTV